MIPLVTLIISVFTAYAVWKYKYRGATSKNDVDTWSRISSTWTTRKWSSMATTQSSHLFSPELAHHKIGKWHLELRPAVPQEAGPAIELFLKLRHFSMFGFLWGPFRANQPAKIKFKISVLREKLRKNNQICEDGGAEPSANEFVVAEETVSLVYRKNIFGPFVVNRDIIECASQEIELTFMVEIVKLGSEDSDVRSCERFISQPLVGEGSENDDEKPIEHYETTLIEDQDREICDPMGKCDSHSGAEVDLLRLRNTLRDVLGRREFSDLKITINTRTFHAHKVILAVRCPSIIKNLLPGENDVTLEGVDPDVFGVVLEFMYASEIDDDLLGLISRDLLRAAVQLNMEDLKTLAEKSLLRTLNTKNAAERVETAYECDSTPIKEQILQFIIAHKKEIISSPEWRSIRKCKHSKEILFDLLNTSTLQP